MFTVRIDGSTGLDWRRHYDKLTHTLIDFPPRTRQGRPRLPGRIGLVFGAFDYGLDTEDRAWFYECNPNGQFNRFSDHITDRILTCSSS